ncbi:MAG: hypothetical protein J0L92_38000 [Deltaproteobacteria bacterium]|nr:hypothetical protein [Deltaproteobacteria bacterium]
MRSLRFVSAIFVLASLSSSASAQRAGTASGLEVIASDGTRVPIGQITGEIQIAPTSDPNARFGDILVRAGLVVSATAGPDARLPAYVEGAIASVLRVDGVPEARLTALHRHGSRLVAQITLGDAVLDDVPIRMRQVRLEGEDEADHSVEWRSHEMELASGTTRLCATPNRACVRLTTQRPISVTVVARRGGWTHVVAEASGLHLEGWAPTRRVAAGEGGLGAWGAGRMGPVSDGCPYEGRPALVAAGTPVSLTPDGAIWARLPDDPDNVWVHDTRPGSAWVEVTFARGVQRSFPGMTCSLGWVPRASVTFDHLREGALSLSLAIEGDRQVVVVHAVPPYLSQAGLAPGDRLLASMVRGQRYDIHLLDDLRYALGVGGTFVVLREGREREQRVPLAPGCEEPGAGQPAACQPR